MAIETESKLTNRGIQALVSRNGLRIIVYKDSKDEVITY